MICVISWRSGLKEGAKIISGVESSVSSGSVSISIVDTDSSSVNGLWILIIGDKINNDSGSITLSICFVVSGIGVYECIIICITVLF